MYLNHTGILFSSTKETQPFVTTQINLEDIVQSETSQTQEGKQCVISLMCGIWQHQVHGNGEQIGGSGVGNARRGWSKEAKL